MKLLRQRLLRASRAAAMCGVLVAGPVLLAAACSVKVTPVNAGGECFLATDCAAGLVCVEQPNKTRACSADLSRVAGRSPPEAGVADARAEGGEGGAREGGAGDSAVEPVPDAAAE